MTTYRCSGCKNHLPEARFHRRRALDRKRPVVAKCKACRSGATKPCLNCGLPGGDGKSGWCQECCQDLGVRECRRCGHVLLQDLHFEPGRRVCHDCRKIIRLKLSA